MEMSFVTGSHEFGFAALPTHAYRPRTVFSGNPFRAGFRAARANLVPGIVIQSLMVALVVAYYRAPAARGWFELLASAKAHWGYAFSFLASLIAGGVLPVALKCVLFQRGRLTRADLAEMLFLCAFWGLDGVIIDGFYRAQALIFGAQPAFAVVAKKVLVDQFLYNPLFAAPYTLACFEFKNQGFRWRRMAHVFTAKFYREQTVPALCATWAVWIPVTSAIYALPSLLQIPLFALALTFWSLLVIYLTARPPASGALPEALAQVVPD
jgi:hypothetical protein